MTPCSTTSRSDRTVASTVRVGAGRVMVPTLSRRRPEQGGMGGLAGAETAEQAGELAGTGRRGGPPLAGHGRLHRGQIVDGDQRVGRDGSVVSGAGGRRTAGRGVSTCPCHA